MSKPALTRNVYVLGLVSFLTDMASEMIVPLVPRFLTRELKATAFHLGIIAGVSESLASFLKLWSGWFSDRLGRRKALIVAGYGVASLVRPLMGLATAWWHAMAVRVVDRVGKGIRIAPRDALLTDSCDERVRGRAFGFQQFADNLGAAIGPLIALAALGVFDARTIMLLAIVPGLLVLVAAGAGIQDTQRTARSSEPPRLTLAPFDARFKLYLAATFVFHLAVISDFLIILRLDVGGFTERETLVAWSCFMALRGACAYAGGHVADRLGRRPMIAAGWLLFAASWGAMAVVPKAWVLAPLAAYAVFGGFAQGPQRAFVADLAPAHLRGTAFGVYNFTLGIAVLVANPVFGWVTDRFDIRWAFLGGAGCALAGLALLAFVGRRLPRAGDPV